FTVTATATSGSATAAFATQSVPAPPPPTPTLASDKQTYAPGASVVLTGAGFQPGDTVHVTVDDDKGDAWDHAADIAVGPGGGFSDTFSLPIAFAATFTATATGGLGGSASTTFSDSYSDPTGTPTIASDQVDYAPGATVYLTGHNWHVGELVHIFVNDDQGKTWARNVDVTADTSGNISDHFSLPTTFVATYSV